MHAFTLLDRAPAWAGLDLLTHLPDAVLLTDAQHNVLAINAAAATLFGCSEEVYGLPVAHLLRISSKRQRKSPAHAGASAERCQCQRRDGTLFFGEVSEGPIIEHGELTGYVYIVRVAASTGHMVKRLQTLHQIVSDSRRSFSDRVQDVLELGRKHFGLNLAIQSCIVGDTYTVVHCASPGNTLQPGMTFEVPGTYCCHTLKAGGAIGFHHAAQSRIRAHPCYLAFRLESYIGCPIIINGEVHGTLNFSSADPCSPFSSDDLAFVEQLALQVGHLLELEQLYTGLKNQANTDVLTGLPNRRAITVALRGQLDSALTAGQPFSIALCDIDRFKMVNDTWGHDAGDLVLRWFADVCQVNIRKHDLIGRFGGEEFLLLFPNSAQGDAALICQRLLKRMHSEPVVFTEATQQVITASFGVAQSQPGESLEVLLSRADQAMYRAKTSGRARVCSCVISEDNGLLQ